MESPLKSVLDLLTNLINKNHQPVILKLNDSSGNPTGYSVTITNDGKVLTRKGKDPPLTPIIAAMFQEADVFDLSGEEQIFGKKLSRDIPTTIHELNTHKNNITKSEMDIITLDDNTRALLIKIIARYHEGLNLQGQIAVYKLQYKLD
jgi:hypothetical protein